MRLPSRRCYPNGLPAHTVFAVVLVSLLFPTVIGEPTGQAFRRLNFEFGMHPIWKPPQESEV